MRNPEPAATAPRALSFCLIPAYIPSVESSTSSKHAIRPLTVCVLGASGDLARRKIFPALFSLFSQNLLPSTVRFVGYARTPMTDHEFRQRLMEHLTCRYVPGERCAEWMERFLALCFYQTGAYDQSAAIQNLLARLRSLEQGIETDRLFYLAIPPDIVPATARAMREAGLATVAPGQGWTRVIVEKPFGFDRQTFEEHSRELLRAFTERQIYRIDHYLGKEIVQNLLVLRFANTVFEPVWNREFIQSVDICWQEATGMGTRGPYFDRVGIIRDIVQNHLLQILSLIAMDRPLAATARFIRNEKVRVLRAVPPVELQDLVVGQYTAGELGGVPQRGYREEPGVAPDSRTPTFAAAVMRIQNDRWHGVPFLVRAGKGLARSANEIRIHFRGVPNNPFAKKLPRLPENDLVIRVQPDEAIILHIISKVPGLELRLTETQLDLRYRAAFQEVIPEAYECMLLDALRGEKGLFLRSDEVAAAWDIWTPVLHELERRAIQPEPYPFGSQGPNGLKILAEREGIPLECSSAISNPTKR